MKNHIMLLIAISACIACAPLPSIDTVNGEKDSERKDYLIAHYTFDNTTEDQSANSYDAVAIGGPSFSTDTPDGSAASLRVNGFKGQFVNIPYPFMNMVKEFTVSMWVKNFSSGILFSAISSNGKRSDYPRLLVTEDQKFRLYTGYDNYDESEPFVYDCLSIMSGDWHFIAVTAAASPDRYGYVRTSLYVDGVCVDSMDKYWSEGEAGKMVLGGDKDGAYPVSMSATYDNVRFYGCALSIAEIKNLYNNRI